jgi:four helix bundle protein
VDLVLQWHTRVGWSNHEQIAAWQRAQELCTMVRTVCDRSSFNCDPRFRAQLIDAGRSGPRNIAEGFARWKHADFARFVRIAKASEVELLNHLREALNCRHINESEHDQLDHAARKAIKAANGLIRWLETHPDPSTGGTRGTRGT